MCHMPYSSRSYLPAGKGSSVLCVLPLWILPPYRGGLRCAMCATASDLAFLQGRALVRHVSYSSESYVLVGEGSGAPRVLQL
jgi:hypothetical protein